MYVQINQQLLLNESDKAHVLVFEHSVPHGQKLPRQRSTCAHRTQLSKEVALLCLQVHGFTRRGLKDLNEQSSLDC